MADSEVIAPSPEQVDLVLEMMRDLAEDYRLYAQVYAERRKLGLVKKSEEKAAALTAVAAYLEEARNPPEFI